MDVKVKIKGVGETINKIQAFNDIAYSELGQAMFDSVNDFITDAKYFAPVDTGFLRDHITGRVISKIRGVIIVGRIRSSARYSIYQEFGCFLSKHVRILTKRGWTALKNVRVGDKVLTHANNWKKVTATHIFNVDKKIDLGIIYTIETKKGYKVTVTGNHPIMTNRGWVRADNIKKEDEVQVVYNDLPAFHYANFVKEPAKKYEVVCAYCGKTKTISKKAYNNNITKIFFCNQECYKLNKKPEYRKFKCPNCGKDLIISETYIRLHPINNNFYCNKICENTYKKGNMVIITCKVCGKQVERFECMEKYKVTEDRYCRAECKKKDMFGDGNPNFGKNHPNMHSEEFKKAQSIRFRGNRNPMFNNIRKHYYSEIGYREDINLRVRSTWEANIARILNYKGLNWEYEPESFELLILNTTYRPDFLINIGNKKCYIEVKGYLTEKAINKMDEFKKLHKDCHFLLIDEDSYKRLEKKFSKKIELWETGSTSICGRNLKFRFDKIVKIKASPWGRRKCYNISVEDDESFISNHIVTHNTSKHDAHPYMITAFNKNKFKMQERFRKAMDTAIHKASVGRYYGGGTMTKQGPSGTLESGLI